MEPGKLLTRFMLWVPVWSKNSSALRYQHLNIDGPCHNSFVSCLK